MTTIPDSPPDVAVSVAALRLAEFADRHRLPITWEEREALAREMLAAALPYLDGVGPT